MTPASSSRRRASTSVVGGHRHSSARCQLRSAGWSRVSCPGTASASGCTRRPCGIRRPSAAPPRRRARRRASGVRERPVPDVEVPLGPVLRLVQLGHTLQRRLVRDANGVALDDDVEPLVDVVAPGRQDAVPVAFEVPRLLLVGARAEEERAVRENGDERRHVRTPVAPYRGDPEDLRVLQPSVRFRPLGRSRPLAAEASVDLTDRLGCAHAIPLRHVSPTVRERRNPQSHVRVARAERRRERAVRGRRPDEGRARRVDAVRAREREREAGERRAAPAGRRAARVRAERALDRPRDDLRAESGAARRARPAPSGRQSKTRCGARGVGPRRPRAPSRGCASAAAATKTPGTPSRIGSRTNGTRSTSAKPSSGAGGSSSRSVRICEVGVSSPGSRRAAAFSSSGVGQRAETLEQPLDEVHLRLRERRVEPDAARRAGRAASRSRSRGSAPPA